MAKVKVKVKEMKDAQASFISLVGRGANRIGFRILKEDKSENEMIDLSAITNIFKGAPVDKPTGPEVVAYAIQPTEDLVPFVEALKSVGVNTETVVKNEDGTVMFVQKQFDASLS